MTPLERVEDLILEGERAKKQQVPEAIEKVERTLRIAGALEACVEEYVEKMHRTVSDFLDKLEGIARDMKEAAER